MCEQGKLILYVDDDEDDRDLLTDAIQKVNPEVEVKLAQNGLEALKFLEEVKSSRLPCLIILDLNMPVLDGKETYMRIKNDETLQMVPVVIFTSSEKPAEKTSFVKLGAEYYTKPGHFAHLFDIANHMVSMCSRA